MANHKSAKKRIRTNEKKRIRNKASLSKINTMMKKVLDSNDKEKVEVLHKEAVAFIDKTENKGRLHKNTAARRKSRLARHVNSLTTAK